MVTAVVAQPRAAFFKYLPTENVFLYVLSILLKTVLHIQCKNEEDFFFEKKEQETFRNVVISVCKFDTHVPDLECVKWSPHSQINCYYF